jgi:hypothetical protein
MQSFLKAQALIRSAGNILKFAWQRQLAALWPAYG